MDNSFPDLLPAFIDGEIGHYNVYFNLSPNFTAPADMLPGWAVRWTVCLLLGLLGGGGGGSAEDFAGESGSGGAPSGKVACC